MKPNNSCILCNSNKYFLYLKKDNYLIVRCGVCNFKYLKPFPSEIELKHFYLQFDYRTGFINENLIRIDAKRTLRNLGRLGYKKGSLLDIGCGAGFFLDEARKIGLETIGIDLSQTAIKHARDILGIKIINSDFLKYEFPNNRFDAITLIQVIEHLVNPYATLRKTHKLLKSGGIICIATPNIDSYLSRVLGKNFNYMIPPEHVAFYSPETLSMLLKKVGFKIIKISTWGYSTDLASIIKFIFKKKDSRISRNNSSNKNDYSKKIIKRLKSFIFDRIFCKIFYSALNYRNGGSIVEIYAKKE